MRKEKSHKRVFICSAYLLDRDILLPKYSQSTAAIRFSDIGQKLPIIIQTAMFLLNSRRNKVEFSLCILVSWIGVGKEIIILTLYKKHWACLFPIFFD